VGGIDIWAVNRHGSANSAINTLGEIALIVATDVPDIDSPVTVASGEWKTLSFSLPDETVWQRTEDNGYMAIGSKDSIA
jgi:hypothetical protein